MQNVQILVSTLLVISLFGPSESKAYSYIDNRGLLPLGEIEAFMANTGTALSGSTGAVYYNPSGLASIRKNNISLSANSYLSTTSEINPIETIDGVDMNFSSKGIQAIPSALVSIGIKDRFRYAFSVLMPHQLRNQDSVLYSTPTYQNLQFSRTNFFQLLLVGLSAATSTEHYDVGVGCFYTMYTTTQTGMVTGRKPSATNALVLNTFYDAQVTGMMCNAGFQRQQNEDLRWGLTVRLPLIAFYKNGIAAQFAQNPNTGASASNGPSPVGIDYKIPTDLSLGFEYRLLPLTFAYFDLSYQMGTAYNTGDIGATTTEFKGTARATSGLRYLYRSNLEFFAGLGYNPSSVSANDSAYAENYFTGTLGGRWIDGNSNLGLGFIYARSSGEREAVIENAALTTIGRKTATVGTQAFGVMINSGFVF